jgi:hypothetical protein
MSLATARLVGLILWGIIGLAMISFDIYLATDSIIGNTWSEMAQKLGQQSMLFPTAIGVLLGHLFWPSAVAFPWWAKLLGLTPIALGMLGIDLFQNLSSNPARILTIMTQYPIIWVVCGTFLGRYFWGQGKY